MTAVPSHELLTGTAVLRRAIGALRAAGIADPALEAELLLRHVLGVDKTCFYLRLPDALIETEHRAFLDVLRQRLRRKPLAYITGHREFYDLELRVAPGVLIPRPETEQVVERCLALATAMLQHRRTLRFVDVGTGSGAIALAVAKHLPRLDVLAVDLSQAALALAALNAKQLRLAGRVRWLAGDLLEPVRETVDLVAANLPYIPSDLMASLDPEVRDHEPVLALDGGPDGLRTIARLLRSLPARLSPGAAAVLEIGHDQGDAIRSLASELAGVPAEILPDLAGADRIAVLRF